MDAPFSRLPLNFVSNLFLAAAVYSRVTHPQVYALTKTDLVSDEEVDTIINWTNEPEDFEIALRGIQEQTFSIVTRDLADAVFRAGLVSEPIPVCAKDGSGLVELNAAVSRILTRGEEATS
jgi:hypothetical protein